MSYADDKQEIPIECCLYLGKSKQVLKTNAHTLMCVTLMRGAKETIRR